MRTARPAAFAARCALPLALLLSGSIGAAHAAPNRSGHSGSSGRCRVDGAQYAALKHGMDQARVRGLLGCAGRRISHLTVGRIARATYSWPARGTYGANITLTFRNGLLTDKAQLGLDDP